MQAKKGIPLSAHVDAGRRISDFIDFLRDFKHEITKHHRYDDSITARRDIDSALKRLDQVRNSCENMMCATVNNPDLNLCRVYYGPFSKDAQ